MTETMPTVKSYSALPIKSTAKTLQHDCFDNEQIKTVERSTIDKRIVI